MDYTTDQRKAIETIDKNLQIIACAGSGKTQVISERIAHIIQSQRVDPSSIVAFTFTEKAAIELKDRIYDICREKLGTDQGLGGMYVGTIHGYCLNILQEPPIYKYLKYSVLSDVCQRLVIDRYSRQSGLADTPWLNGGKLRRWLNSELYQKLLSICAEADVDYDLIPDEVKASVSKYRSLLHEHKYLDFTTIQMEALSVLESHGGLRKKINEQVRYIIVDEYQDINPLQERIIKSIFGLTGNICVVGDDDQTIYQWRGSDVQNIITFKDRYPDVETVSIGLNFRSSEAIVDAARKFVERIPNRLDKEMGSSGSQVFRRGDILALSFNTPEDEAAWIAAKVGILRETAYQDKPGVADRGLSYSDFAILLRSVRKDARPIMDALDAMNIPYIVDGMDGLFETPEIKAMRQVFFYLSDYTDAKHTPPTLAQVRQDLETARLGLSQERLNDACDFLKETKELIPTSNNAKLHLQRLYLDFLGKIHLCEEGIDRVSRSPKRSEIVFYNLGKFSAVISDFENINFKSNIRQLYPDFASFLLYQAQKYYPEGAGENGYGRPDAVQIMTVHKAKGMQWPAVFVPCLRKNRFPSKRQGGKGLWHIIPEAAVSNVDRFKGTNEDERRLFYVAVTRAEKYLFCSWSPLESKPLYRKISEFQTDFSNHDGITTADPPAPSPRKITAKQRQVDLKLPLTFSELKYYFDCPYLFKLRFLYGFNEPIQQAMGFGKSLHDALAEIHAESIKGVKITVADVDRLYDDHFFLPFISPANTQLKENLETAFKKDLAKYIEENSKNFDKLEHVEKTIELNLADGVVVNGRIDLIRHTETGELTIVDFKSDAEAQDEETTKKQLHIYALGYKQLTGKSADLIEIHNLKHGGAIREVVTDALIAGTVRLINDAGADLRNNHLDKSNNCSKCSMKCVCKHEHT
jgi:DNA helicase-2/ATP-dependent DNA helicase PcrA